MTGKSQEKYPKSSGGAHDKAIPSAFGSATIAVDRITRAGLEVMGGLIVGFDRYTDEEVLPRLALAVQNIQNEQDVKTFA